jgi:alkylation response protein AidB-like acyl-CoA dehydrogenase
VDYADSPEQAALREVVRDFCGHHAASAGILAGLAIGDQYGGTGAGLAEVAVAAQELARVLLPVPYLSTAVAGAVLSEGDPEVAGQFLPGLASGELTAAFALDAKLTARDVPARDGWLYGQADGPGGADAWGGGRGGSRALISGLGRHVLDGAEAGLFLARATNDALYVVRAEAAIVEPSETLDETRSQATVTFCDSPALATGVSAVRAESLLRALLAAESAAAAQRCLEDTVAYLHTRRQFGRVIGSFQALKHRCADLAVQVTAARATAAAAVSACAGDPGQFALTAALAKVYCADAFWHAAAEMVQLHGGIGFTWEHEAHRYLKRAKTTQLMLGTPGELRRLIADLAGLR